MRFRPKVGKPEQVPANRCRCGANLDGRTKIGELGGKGPIAGDVSICRYCGRIAVFTSDMALREPTRAELQAIMGEPQLRQLVERVLAHVASGPGPGLPH